MTAQDLEESIRIVDRLAEVADEDLDLVAQAIRIHSIRRGRDVVVDVELAETWIRREMDAKEFD